MIRCIVVSESQGRMWLWEVDTHSISPVSFYVFASETMKPQKLLQRLKKKKNLKKKVRCKQQVAGSKIIFDLSGLLVC